MQWSNSISVIEGLYQSSCGEINGFLPPAAIDSCLDARLDYPNKADYDHGVWAGTVLG